VFFFYLTLVILQHHARAMGKVTSIRLDDDVVEIWEQLNKRTRGKLVNDLLRDQALMIQGFEACIEALRKQKRYRERRARIYGLGYCRICGRDYSISTGCPTICRECYNRTQTKLEVE